MAIGIGWGIPYDEAREIPSILKETDLQILEHETCNNITSMPVFAEEHKQYGIAVNEKNICVGNYEKYDTNICNGKFFLY